MLVNVRRTFFEEIDIPSETVNEIVERKLLQMVSPGEYIKDDEVMRVVDNGHSIFAICVRDATELDKAVFKVLKEIKKSP